MKHILPLLTLSCLGCLLLHIDAAEPNTPQPKRPQEPKRPFPYVEEEVQFDNPRAEVKLAGTLTRPMGQGPFPAVLLVAGSGPLTRDEIVFDHRVFLLLSDYLTRRGLAVLRYDKRGVAQSTGDYEAATTLEFTDDAVAGMDYLKSRMNIDPKRIGAAGHSEGGIIVPTVAVRWPDAAFIVMLAGTGTTGEEIIMRQNYLESKAAGATAEKLAAQDADIRRCIEIAKSKADRAEVERQLRPLIEAAKKGNQTSADILAAYYGLPWTRFFLTHSPVPALEKVRCPVLALCGGRDLLVPPKENLQGIARALAVSANTDFVIREMPGLNHLLQHCLTGLDSEYPKIKETMSPEVLQIVGDWILQHVK